MVAFPLNSACPLLLLLLLQVLLQHSPQDGVPHESRLGVGASSRGVVAMQLLVQLLESEQRTLLLLLLQLPRVLLLLLLGR